jgi:hypothetical protein
MAALTSDFEGVFGLTKLANGNILDDATLRTLD